MIISQINRTSYVQSLYRSKQNQRKPETILTSFIFDSRKLLSQNTPALRKKPAHLKIKKAVIALP